VALQQLVCTGLSEDQLRQAAPGHCSIAWLLWHTARTEDVAINTVLRDAPEVLDQDGWLRRLGLTARDIGTGMTDDEVSEFGTRVDVAALRAYHTAVGAQTRAWLTTADLAELEGEVKAPGDRLQASAALRERGAWVAEFWTGRPRSWFLTWVSIGHNYWHMGEAEHIARTLGRPGR
jgi:hypothetical protein